ncbi:uncharacterized protein LOC118149700 isoform X2 [Callithrix jacchus]
MAGFPPNTSPCCPGAVTCVSRVSGDADSWPALLSHRPPCWHRSQGWHSMNKRLSGEGTQEAGRSHQGRWAEAEGGWAGDRVVGPQRAPGDLAGEEKRSVPILCLEMLARLHPCQVPSEPAPGTPEAPGGGSLGRLQPDSGRHFTTRASHSKSCCGGDAQWTLAQCPRAGMVLVRGAGWPGHSSNSGRRRGPSACRSPPPSASEFHSPCFPSWLRAPKRLLPDVPGGPTSPP